MEYKKRFWNKIEKKEPDKCWIWKGAKQKSGYGRFKINGKLYLAHRVCYELTFGIIPNNLWVLHKCDNPKCVNPHHLFLGTRSDNMNDALKKGRLKITLDKLHKSNPHKKINSNQIKEIKILIQNGSTEREIGKLFNICHQSVNYIKHREDGIFSQR